MRVQLVCGSFLEKKTNKQVNLKRKNGNITLVALLDIVIKPSSCFDRPIDDHTDSLQLSSAIHILINFLRHLIYILERRKCCCFSTHMRFFFVQHNITVLTILDELIFRFYIFLLLLLVY